MARHKKVKDLLTWCASWTEHIVVICDGDNGVEIDVYKSSDWKRARPLGLSALTMEDRVDFLTAVLVDLMDAVDYSALKAVQKGERPGME